MPAYSVYLPAATRTGADISDAPIIVIDGFSKSACVLGPLWCVAQRAWLALIMWVLLAGGVVGVALFAPVSEQSVVAVAVLLLIGFGFEADLFYRRALEQRGFRLADHFIAATVEQAERRFFDRWTQNSAAAAVRRPNSSQPTNEARAYPGLSLFPDAGG